VLGGGFIAQALADSPRPHDRHAEPLAVAH
jgi:hypothetical protein